MPGRTARQADAAFLGPLRRALSCITDAQLFVSPPAPVRALLVSGGDLTGGDLEVPPKREDWADVLAETEARFVAHRRWHA